MIPHQLIQSLWIRYTNITLASSLEKYKNQICYMGSPKHQHFIPKSFLKQFALKNERDKYLIDTLMRGDAKITTLTTTQVCVQKNIYTFPEGVEGDRFALEKRYAVEVDAVYPEVYALLSDPTIHKLTLEQKSKILNTVLSLYFRTPFFLNEKNERLDVRFDRFSNLLNNNKEQLIYNHDNGTSYTLTKENIEDVRAMLKIENKIKFLEEHLEQWKSFVEHKMVCGMEVIEVSDEVPLISSDNPVLILGSDGRPNYQDIFHPDNIIEVAIDPKKYLIIYPNAVSEEESLDLKRGSRDKYFAAGVNLRTEETSDGRVLGYPGDVHKHFESQQKLGEDSEENIDHYSKFIRQTMLLDDLMKTVTKSGGTMLSKAVIEKVRELFHSGELEGSEPFEKILKMYKDIGINI
ncbi:MULTISPECIES: DUF4238 domain-containing protein [Sphingobacterium]|nr:MULTISPECIES: DUF4238 domain-containing protein [Sphingobacterium]